MTQKIKFDTARYCRSNAGRMGQWIGQDVAGLIGAEVEGLKAELSALKAAAGPVVDAWSLVRTDDDDGVLQCDGSGAMVPMGCLDELARLCGEG